MSYDLDSGVVLYVVGVLFGLIALGYFLSDVVFGLSITVRAALLGLAFVALLVGGLALERDVLDLVSFALAAAAYVAFVWYVVTRYDLGRTGAFLAFALSAALFVALGFGVRERGLAVPPRTAAAVVVVLVLVAGALVGADALDDGVTYGPDLASSVELEPAPEGDRPIVEERVGELTARNDGVFARPLDWPTVHGCVAGTDAFEDVDVHRDWTGPSDDLLRGGQTRSVTLQFFGVGHENVTLPSSLAVERASSCDVERSEPTLLVLIGEERPPRAV